MATERITDIMSDKFNVNRICS